MDLESHALHNVPSTIFWTLTPQNSLLKCTHTCLLNLYELSSYVFSSEGTQAAVAVYTSPPLRVAKKQLLSRLGRWMMIVLGGSSVHLLC